MSFSIQNHEHQDMLVLSYAMAAALRDQIPALEPLFASHNPHEVALGDLVPMLDSLTEAVQEWIRAGWRDQTRRVRFGRDRQRIDIEPAALVLAARDLRDTVEEQVARGRSIWIA